MRILGVDPGLTRCGVGIIDSLADRSVRLVNVTVITTDKDLELPMRLLQLQKELALLIDEFQPARIAVERVFAQHNLRTVMGTAQASAVAFVEAASRGIPVDLHTPSEVKASVTGTGRANKVQVASMVGRLLILPEGKLLPDATDALALAICNAWRGGPVTTSPGALTPAQQRWREAERQAKKRG
ncbi:crossover junction endodeoxyribonuclease RuvC [Aurantimicrobium minutum]|uniref:crossover junction endodeoxyribonuclease RuvC n=1 Tax=Aurantimicrobium minutum TaxID=708131 RepID=UPI002476F29E|nr:crossover junction endodeoxyribonuclease RuvC [Aurantimicrobium minutum]MDH6533015.1 crossover junction endodeoxyribonuclease RuvC [Aurantimicrobium minutum]